MSYPRIIWDANATNTGSIPSGLLSDGYAIAAIPTSTVFNTFWNNISNRLYNIENGMQNGVKTGLDVSCVSNLFTIPQGSCSYFGTRNIGVLSTTWTKTIATWAAGTGNGSLVGTLNTGWNYFFEISDADQTLIDFALDDNLTCNNIPNGYTQYRRIALAFSPDGTNITDFLYVGNNFYSANLYALVQNAQRINGATNIVTYNSDFDSDLPSAINLGAVLSCTMYGEQSNPYPSNPLLVGMSFYSTLDSSFNPSLASPTPASGGFNSLEADIAYSSTTATTLEYYQYTTKKIINWGTGTRDLNITINVYAATVAAATSAKVYIYNLIDYFSDF